MYLLSNLVCSAVMKQKKKRLLQIEDWMKLLLHLVEPRVHRASVLSRRQCAVMLRTPVLPYL